MSTRIGWAELLAQPGGPGRVQVHERTLRLAREEAAGKIVGTMERVVTGADEALAAIAILRGSIACRDFPPAIAPVVEHIGRRHGMFPDSIADLGVLGLLALVEVSEAIGAPLTLPSHDVDHRFGRFLTNKALSRADKVTVALLALILGRTDDARLIVKTDVRGASGKSGADPMILVKALAAAKGSKPSPAEADLAFDAFLREFPAALAAQKAQWRQLMLVAILVIGKLGGTPISEVADEVHRRVEKLAAEESS